MCSTEKEGRKVLEAFCEIACHLCRIMRKFYSLKLQGHLQNSLEVMRSGFEIFANNYRRRGANGRTESEQIKSFLRIIDRSVSSNCRFSLQEHAFVIRLLSRIVFSWKSIRLYSQNNRISNSGQLNPCDSRHHARKEN